MTTTADEKFEAAREHIRDAIADMHAIVVAECWGHDDYDRGARVRMYEAMRTLIDVRMQLEGGR